MKKHAELIEEVKNLIAKNKTGKALELLAKEQLSNIDKDLIMLNSRFSKITDDQRMGVIDDESAQITLNKINLDLLALAEIIEKKSGAVVHPNPSPKPEPFTPKAEKNNTSKFIMMGVGALLLTLVAVWGMTRSHHNDHNDPPKTPKETSRTSKGTKSDVKETAGTDRTKIIQDSIEADKKQKLAAAAAAEANLKPVKLGDKHQGGIVFYVDESGKHGLIMAQGDISNEKMKFFDGPMKKAMAFDSGIYEGKKNTDKIVKALGQEGNYPAKLCQDLVLDDYSDWYLPSREELDLIWDFSKIENNKAYSGIELTHDYYWSSTELNGQDVYYRSFYNGKSFYKFGRNKGKVRPIRSF